MIRRPAAVLCAGAGLALVAIGAGALALPAASGAGYGIAAESPAARAYVRALGARDLALGIAVLRFLRTGSREALRTMMAVCAVVGAADATIVASARAAPGASRSLGVHVAGTLGLVLTFALLRDAR